MHPPVELPSRIGDLVVDGLLGEGGMGRVYLCTDNALGRQIAVKALQPSLLPDTVMRERFVREARALARVKSAHVVTVHAIGEDTVIGPFVVMERLIGEDLLARLHSRGSLGVDEVVVLARAAALGLTHAHEAGVVHRDIKPANLFCKSESREGDGEHLVITDFGLAKDVGGSEGGLVPASQLTQADVIVGTPAYLAPELARGQAASPSSDLYALGATLYHLLVGEPPFVGESTIEVITKAVLEAAPRASTKVAGLPVGLDDLIASLLEKRPEDRPESAAAVTATLAALVTSSGLATAPMSATPSRPWTPPPTTLVPLSERTPVASSNSPNMTQVMGSLRQGTPSPPPRTSPTDDTMPSLSRAALEQASPALTSTVMPAERRFFGLEPGDERPFSQQPKVWAAATLVGCVLLAIVLASLVGGGRRNRIEGDAAAVQAEIEKIDNKKANDLVDLGLAQWTQDQRKAAFSTWRQAVVAGADDELMLLNAFAAFENKDDKGAEGLLVAWQAPIEPGLRDALRGTWWPRHHALAVLEGRNAATDEDRHAVALKDISEGDCASRRYGVLALKRFGKGNVAMSAIKQLQNNLANNLCMALDLKPTEDAIRRRTNAGK